MVINTRLLHGRLTAESVEGGGIFLVDCELGRVELRLSRPLRLVGPPARIVDEAGTQIAAAGDLVVIGGSPAEHIVSFRQQGAMFQVMTVELDRG